MKTLYIATAALVLAIGTIMLTRYEPFNAFYTQALSSKYIPSTGLHYLGLYLGIGLVVAVYWFMNSWSVGMDITLNRLFECTLFMFLWLPGLMVGVITSVVERLDVLVAKYDRVLIHNRHSTNIFQ